MLWLYAKLHASIPVGIIAKFCDLIESSPFSINGTDQLCLGQIKCDSTENDWMAGPVKVIDVELHPSTGHIIDSCCEALYHSCMNIDHHYRIVTWRYVTDNDIVQKDVLK